MQDQSAVMAFHANKIESTDLKIVVRRTFLDLDEYEEPEFAMDGRNGRERSFSDSWVNYGSS